MKRFKDFGSIFILFLLMIKVYCTINTFFECQDISKGIGLIMNGTADDVLSIPIKFFYLVNEINDWRKLIEQSDNITEYQKKEINESLAESGRIHKNDVEKIINQYHTSRRFKRGIAGSAGSTGVDIALTVGYDYTKEKFLSGGKAMVQHFQIKDVIKRGSFKAYIQQEMATIRQQKTADLKRLLFSSDLSQLQMVIEYFKSNNVGSWKIQGITISSQMIIIHVSVQYYSQSGNICFKQSFGAIVKNETYHFSKTVVTINGIKVNKCEPGSFGVLLCYHDNLIPNEEEIEYLNCCYHRSTKKYDVVVVDVNNYPGCNKTNPSHYKIYTQKRSGKNFDCTNFIL